MIRIPKKILIKIKTKLMKHLKASLSRNQLKRRKYLKINLFKNLNLWRKKKNQKFILAKKII